MLVLTRRAGQTIRVGDDLEIEVIRIEGDRVVIGVAAPRDVPIVRGELVAEVTAETRTAAEARGRLKELLARR